MADPVSETPSVEVLEAVINGQRVDVVPLADFKALERENAALREQVESLRDALDHIQRVANNGTHPTRRLDWMAQRARYALAGKPWSNDEREEPRDRVREIMRHNEKLREQVAKLEKERDAEKAAATHALETMLMADRAADEAKHRAERAEARAEAVEAALRRIAITDDADCALSNNPRAMTDIARAALDAAKEGSRG